MVQVPPPVWMFLLLAGASGASTLWPGGFLGVRAPIAGAGLVALSLALSVWAWGLFRIERTEIMPTSKTNKKLVIAGPFRFTRNPMYLGLVLFSLGLAFWSGHALLYAVPVLVFAICNWVHIPFEEGKMRRQFGDAFDAYCKRVRRWI